MLKWNSISNNDSSVSSKRIWVIVITVVVIIAVILTITLSSSISPPIAMTPAPVVPVLPTPESPVPVPTALPVTSPAPAVPPKPIVPTTPPVTEPAPPVVPPPIVTPEETIASPLSKEFWGKGYSPSPPTIQNGQMWLYTAWMVPAETVIFAPFDGKITFLSWVTEAEENMEKISVFQGTEWAWADLGFEIAAHHLEPLVERGQEVKAGDPIARVGSEKLIEGIKNHGDFNIILDFNTTNLDDEKLNQWYKLLVRSK